MNVTDRYRNFGAPVTQPEQTNDDPSISEFENDALLSFDEGYKAGWEDATKAERESSNQLVDEISQKIQEFSFTHREAVIKVSRSFESVLTEVFDLLLPKALNQVFSVHIIEQLKSLVKDNIDQPIRIIVSTKSFDLINSILEQHIAPPFVLVADGALSENEAFISVGDTEKQINFDEIIQQIESATSAFYHELESIK